MAKMNVNAATREELAEATELRPELAEAIVKLRDERGKIGSVEELAEVQGVGPATLERLRETLSFGATAEEKAERDRARAEEKAAQEKEQMAREKAEAKAEAERERIKAEEKAERERVRTEAKAAQEKEQMAREAAEKKAAAERERVQAEEKAERERVKAAQEEERVAREAAEKTAEAGRAAARASAEAASKVVRGGLELVQKRVGATAEVQTETLRKSAEGTAEFGKLFMDVLSEQTRHNMQVAVAFGRVVQWDEIARVQSEFIRASFERFSTLNSRYAEIVQGVIKTAADSAKEQAKAA